MMLTGSTFRAAGLDNIAEVDPLGWNLTIDRAARAKEVNAFPLSSVANDTVLGDEMKLYIVESENRRHAWVSHYATI